MNASTYSFNSVSVMWSLLNLNRNRALYRDGGPRGRCEHHLPDYHHHQHHRRAPLVRHHAHTHARTHAHSPGVLVGCCNSRDKVVSSGSVSIVIGILVLIYATYEMHKAGEFYDNNSQIPVPVSRPTYPELTRPPPTSPSPPPKLPTPLPHEANSFNSTNSTNIQGQTAKKTHTKQYYDKYGAEISQEKFEYLIGQEQLDKGLCVALTFLGAIQMISSGLLIRGVKLRDKRSYIPWMIITSCLMTLGLIYVLFNIVTLDFNASVNFVLFLWIVACVIEFHCLKSVLRAFREGTLADRFRACDEDSPMTAREMFNAQREARRVGHDVFTITNGNVRTTEIPVRIMMKPPSYEEATHALDDLGPPPDPPEDDGTPMDKPPEYTP